MIKIFILVSWFSTHGGTFTIEEYDSSVKCEAVKEAIIETYKEAWRGPTHKNTKCIEVIYNALL